MTEQTTIHIAIGNSDDKLSQSRWADYVAFVDWSIRAVAAEVHGAWHSLPTSQWQNAAWAFVIRNEAGNGEPEDWLRKRLAKAAHRYDQDSVAWNESVTEFIEAAK